ncbi:DNA-binding protein [Hydrogenophaga sp.]|jgi:hypothetical protein|uniref:DNA-binding protein n=1 Tax=Hydrogenophaga sp. TaxID=1904254 RepID=UPI00391A3E81
MNDLKQRRAGRPGVTLDDVRAACIRLEDEGRFVGAVNVRLELGRGSYTTIQRHLRVLGYVGEVSASRRKT